MSATPQIGAPAPQFELTSHLGEALGLSELTADSKLLLVFYPFAFSGVCGGEMDQLSGLHGAMAQSGMAVAAVSCDPKHSLTAYADSKNLPFTLLSDFWPHGEVSKAYGVFNDKAGMATRGTFLIGRDGSVEKAFIGEVSEARNFAEFAGLE